jgi:hypothetical protein
LFGDDDDDDSNGSTRSRYPLPLYVFAESPIARHSQHKMNFREAETVGPIAAKVMRHYQKNHHHYRYLITVVDDSYADETLYDLAHTFKHSIRHTDGNIISYPRPLPLYRPKYITYWEVTSETEERNKCERFPSK